jgi:hypothetical protein
MFLSAVSVVAQPSSDFPEGLMNFPVFFGKYTFTIKQYAEQNNETEYTEQNIRNNKNT